MTDNVYLGTNSEDTEVSNLPQPIQLSVFNYGTIIESQIKPKGKGRDSKSLYSIV